MDRTRLLEELCDDTIDEVIIVSDDGYNYLEQFNGVMYKKSNDTYYLHASDKQLRYQERGSYRLREINSTTLKFNNHTQIMSIHMSNEPDNNDDDYKLYHISTVIEEDDAELGDLYETLLIICKNNYSYPLIEELKTQRDFILK